MNGLGALMFATAVLLVTANMDSFSDEDKQLANLLIKTANEQFKFRNYLDYSEKLQHDEYPKADLIILLKPTKCPRETSDFKHRPECALQNGKKTPTIDCIACHNNFVHCELLPRIQPNAGRQQHCGRHWFGEYGISQTQAGK